MSATTGTRLFTWVYGRFVGQDEFGNRYYESRRVDKAVGKKRRWVMYRGKVEASKIPAEWHGWMHYTLDAPLAVAARRGWQRAHQPNLTGTTGRHLPQGHISKGGARAASSADYEPWSPR